MCNAFAMNFGLFLHASGTSQRAIHALSQVGISTSPSSINRTVEALSKDTHKAMQHAGQSLQYTMVYDNLVIDFGSPGQSIVEQLQKTMRNITTGTFINHHFNPDDLRCAEEIRRTDRYNDRVDHSQDKQYNYYDLLDTYDSDLSDASQSSSSQSSDDEDACLRPHFFAWILREAICTHGPAFFHVFRARNVRPETLEQLPIRKTEQVPCRAMKYENSTVNGNIESIEDMMEQAGIRRTSETASQVPGELPSVSEYVLIVSGDLGSGERIDSGRRCRAMEICVWNTLYHIIFVPGMFHVKMAIVDMLWKLFIKPFSSTSDSTSAVRATQFLCAKAKDTTKILKGPPTYQQMKRFLKHLGTAERLTCWRTALESRFGPTIWTDLDDKSFNAQFTLRFTWDDIVSMSDDLVTSFFNIGQVRDRRESKDDSLRDSVLENTMLRNYYMLLYEESIYAMNFGDIGRLQQCLIDWIPAFRAVGKHKYAYHLTSFFINLKYRYPEKLQ